MDNKSNKNLGDDIINIVQNALNNKDFQRLNRDVQNIAKDALDEARMAIGLKSRPYQGSQNINSKIYNENQRNQSTLRETESTNITRQNTAVKINSKTALNVTKHTVPMGQVSGVLLSVFGGIGTVGFGIALSVLTILGITLESFFFSIALFLLPFFLVSLGLSVKGSNVRKRLKRFQKYVVSIGNRGYASLMELASATGMNKALVEKDLRKMISVGMFPEGHIDNKKTTFILTNDLYKQYQQVQYLEVQKNIATKNVREIQEEVVLTINDDGLTSEMRRSLDEGLKFVRDIKEANEAIPGEEISLKLDRLEEVTAKIFKYVETHPEKFNDIRKFTDYFLPTTLKLLDAYRKLDYQAVQGQNISSAKEEIEKTMDTINIAFENLLDDLFQDMAMDISTDISVLETMFAQEGLTKDEMRLKNMTMEDKE